MSIIVEINQDNFQKEVIENSYSKPVVVDFFATWCGPCQILKPMLEKLAQEYDFILAKVDIDVNPDLANEFGVEGVPDVRIVQQGQMQPGFVGALPEAQLRSFIEQLNLKSDLNDHLDLLEQAIANKNYPQAKKILDQLFGTYPGHPKVILQAVRFLMVLDRMADGEKLLGTMKNGAAEYSRQVESLQTLIQYKQLLQTPTDSDLDAKFAQGINLAVGGNYEPALTILLEIIQANRQYREDGARKAMLAIFNWLGSQHPLSRQYRQKLMIIL